MITGRKGFEGSSQASLIAAMMSFNPPPVSTIQPMASSALDRLVREMPCKIPGRPLAERRRPAQRARMDNRIRLKGRHSRAHRGEASQSRAHMAACGWPGCGAAPLGRWSGSWSICAMNLPQPRVVRFQIPVPDKLNFFFYQLPSVSPDGERIAFTAAASTNRPRQAFRSSPECSNCNGDPRFRCRRPLSLLVARRAPNRIHPLEGLWRKWMSPGGPPVTICSSSGDGATVGGTWNRDGVILSTTRSVVLFRVPAAGGDPKPLRPLAEGETAQRWPQFLPDGNHYLYLSVSNRPDQQGIYVASLDSSERKFIVATNTNAAYLESGQLLFMRGDVLMVQPFDLRNLKLRANRVQSQTTSSWHGNSEGPSRSPASPPLPTVCWCGAQRPILPNPHCSGSIAAARDSVSLARPQTTRTRLSPRTIRNWPSASAIRRPRRATSGSLICCAARGPG